MIFLGQKCNVMFYDAVNIIHGEIIATNCYTAKFRLVGDRHDKNQQFRH